MRPLVIYHANCYDGFGAAWASWLALGDEPEYRPAAYGDAPPADVAGRNVYIFDFSWPRADLDRLALSASYLRVLDHHKTAQADLEGAPYAVFDLERSGATLAWDFWHMGDYPCSSCLPGLSRRFVEYLEDRDLWRWALPKSREISAVVASYPFDFGVWSMLARGLAHEEGFEELAVAGTAILRYQRRAVERMVEQATWRELGGCRVPVVNASMLFSEVGDELCRRYPDVPFAAYYFDRADGQRQWGLRSRGGFDVSVVAKACGGGGHAAAAGWVEEIP